MASKAQTARSIVEHPGWNKAQRGYFQDLENGLPIVMSYLSGDIPELSNHTDQQLVDETGVLKTLKKGVEKAEKAHVERLKARLDGTPKLRGEEYEASIRNQERYALHQETVKNFIGKADSLEVDLMALLDLIAKKEIALPNSVFLQEVDGVTLSNESHFFASTGVPTLTVKSIL